jgi:hypothetical protein
VDVLERPPDKHPEVRVRHPGVGRRGQRRCFEVRDLLDARLWLLQGRRRVRQLRGVAAAASEPGADSEPGSRGDAPADAGASAPAPVDDGAAGNHQAPCSSAAAPSSSSSSSSSSSGGIPRQQVLGVDQLARGRDLVAAHRRRLGAGWPDRPERQIPSSQVLALGHGRLRLGGLCRALCNERLRRGAMGES